MLTINFISDVRWIVKTLLKLSLFVERGYLGRRRITFVSGFTCGWFQSHPRLARAKPLAVVFYERRLKRYFLSNPKPAASPRVPIQFTQTTEPSMCNANNTNCFNLEPFLIYEYLTGLSIVRRVNNNFTNRMTIALRLRQPKELSGSPSLFKANHNFQIKK